MDGNEIHANLLRFFPGAQAAECRGDGMWASVTSPGQDPRPTKCPGCAYERLAVSVAAFVPPRFGAAISLPAEAAAWVKRGAAGRGLYLTGQVGTGKTHTAWAAVAAWCLATWTEPAQPESPGGPPNVIFARVTDLLDDLRPGDGARQRVRECQTTKLLVLDDLGAEKVSEWTQERLYSIIDHRYAVCAPLIVTGNLPPLALAAQTGNRTDSRLAEMCQVIPITGDDRRKQRRVS